MTRLEVNQAEAENFNLLANELIENLAEYAPNVHIFAFVVGIAKGDPEDNKYTCVLIPSSGVDKEDLKDIMLQFSEWIKKKSVQ